jgi:hypothetical protein
MSRVSIHSTWTRPSRATAAVQASAEILRGKRGQAPRRLETASAVDRSRVVRRQDRLARLRADLVGGVGHVPAAVRRAGDPGSADRLPPDRAGFPVDAHRFAEARATVARHGDVHVGQGHVAITRGAGSRLGGAVHPQQRKLAAAVDTEIGRTRLLTLR